MLAAERQRQIVERVKEEGSARVAVLARTFGVTEETIRRDLDKLGRKGLVRRIHGGATQIGTVHGDRLFEGRRSMNLAAKRAIARAAVRHIEEGDVVALDASSTVAELVPFLPDCPFTVLTNSLVVVNALLHHSHAQVVCTGGIFDQASMSFVGTLAERALRDFRISKLFFSSQGVDGERGLSVAEDHHGRIKGLMIELAERSFLLADRTKIGHSSTFFFADLGQVHRLISDARPAELDGAEVVLESVSIGGQRR